jgi:hypothetical protein
MTAFAADHDLAPPQALWRWGLVALYFAAICLLHLQFSLWLTADRDLPWGRGTLAQAVPAAALAGAVALAVVVVRQLRRAKRRWPLAASWLLWVAAVLAIDRWLTFSANEAFHYPQYALLAILIARSLDPGHRQRIAGRVLFWTTLAGALDELLQYLWITAPYSHYFDFNDVLVNLVAAFAGVLLYLGSAPAARRSPAGRPRWAIATALALAAAVAVLLATGRMQLAPPRDLPPGGVHRDDRSELVLYLQRSVGQYGSWQPGPRRGAFYVLPPHQALPLIAVTAVLFTLLADAAGRQAAVSTIQRSSRSKSV